MYLRNNFFNNDHFLELSSNYKLKENNEMR